MDAISVIRTKRDRGELTDEQIDWVIDAYTRGAVADEQMSALAMAILLNGMNRARDRPLDRRDDRLRRADGLLRARPARPPTSTPPAASATRSRCRWPRWSPPAARPCPQLSGRGLGHTGGTLDKLESIPGWRALALQRGDAGACWTSAGAVDLRGRRRPGPGRQEAVRAARRHRHGRGDPADRLLDHVQEDRRGHRRAGPGREGRLRRVHEERRRRPRTGRARWSASAPTTACAPSRCSPTWPPRSA